jgi:hypothetical protein
MENNNKKPPQEEGPHEERPQPKERKTLAKSEQAISEEIQPEEISSDEFEKMPVEISRTFRSFMAMFSQVGGPRFNPLFEKFTEAHIDKYLDYVQRDDDNEYELKKSNRWFYFGYVILALAIFCAAVVYLLPRDKDLLFRLIEIIVLLAGGLGAGYGLKSRQ